MTPDRVRTTSLFLAAFVAGWVIMQLEILGSRVLAPYFGYSIHQWGALIGVVMAAMALGYWVGGRLGDRPRAQALLLAAFTSSTLFTLLVPRLAERLLPTLRGLGPEIGALGASALLLGLPSFLLATTSPIVVRLTASDRLADSAGRVYALSTAGSIGGTFFTAFFAVPVLGSRVSHYVAAVLLAVAVVALAIPARRFGYAIAAAALLLPAYPFAPSRTSGVLYEGESRHSIIRVEEAGEWRALRVDGAVSSIMRRSALLTGSYDDFFLLGPHLASGPDVLVLGVAGGNAVRQLVQSYPDVKVTGVELDPEVIAVARKYFDLDRLPRVELVSSEARWFLSRTTREWDVVVVDLYVAGNIPFFACTREFFELARSRLREGGVLLMNVLAPSSPELILGPLARTLHETFADVFEVRSGTNHVVIATREPVRPPALRSALGRSGATPDVDRVLRRALASLKPLPADPHWPIFSDDRNDVELRMARTAAGALIGGR